MKKKDEWFEVEIDEPRAETTTCKTMQEVIAHVKKFKAKGYKGIKVFYCTRVPLPDSIVKIM